MALALKVPMSSRRDEAHFKVLATGDRYRQIIQKVASFLLSIDGE